MPKLTNEQRLALIRLLEVGEEITPEWAHVLFPTKKRIDELVCHDKGIEKVNCWQFKKCGREAGGARIMDLGICPAATEERLDGIHGGLNSGRACWVVAGTLCEGEIQGIFSDKYGTCKECDFYQIVLGQEIQNFIPSYELLALLKSSSIAGKKIKKAI